MTRAYTVERRADALRVGDELAGTSLGGGTVVIGRVVHVAQRSYCEQVYVRWIDCNGNDRNEVCDPDATFTVKELA